MTNILAQLQELLSNPFNSLFLILNICLLEIVLSFDNAAIIATMVKDLPEDKRNKALKYGIVGAYVFRGLALLFATSLISIWWLKPIGGAYLLWMSYSYFKGKSTDNTYDDTLDKHHNWFYKLAVGSLGIFWSTVIMVEFMDLTLSVDNVFAVVAFSNNMILICLGVFVGILAMRFIASKMIIFMRSYPFLETCAFSVIGILGVKLMLSVLIHFNSNYSWIESEIADWIMSIITLLIFIIPVVYHKIKLTHINTILIILFSSILFTSCIDNKNKIIIDNQTFVKYRYNPAILRIKNMEYVIVGNESTVNITLDSIMIEYYKNK